ncbi:MAG: GTPase [Acidimicrobiia bacterium]
MFNRLTIAEAEASNALFVTLDPLVRRVDLPDRRELLLSDKVVFIDRLPPTRVAAFRATLEETADADLVLHVIDAANPERERHLAAVLRVLEEVGAIEVPRVEVYNKIDMISPDEQRRVQEADPSALLISAHRGTGITELLESVAARLALDQERVTVELDLANPVHADRLAWLYRHATVHSHATMGDRATVEADVPRRLLPMVGLATPATKKAGGRRAR